MPPIVSSSSVASLEIGEMYKINGEKTAGKEILGHAFKGCLTKKKKKSFFQRMGTISSLVFYTIDFVGHNMCISGYK